MCQSDIPFDNTDETPSLRAGRLADHRCFFCIGTRFEKLLDLYGASPNDKHKFVARVANLYADHGYSAPTNEFIYEIYNLLYAATPDTNPFWPHKKRMNDLALELQSTLKMRTRMAGNAFHIAMRIALAGSMIDFLSATHETIRQTVDQAILLKPKIDHSAHLRERIKQGTRILYLTDKAGEIVLDRLFIRNIPAGQVTCVVNCPYAGLATSGQDADYVYMRKCARVLDNGCRAPLTIPHRGSPRFLEAFHSADIIIAKGQTNLESLYDYHDPRVYSLFTCKCQLVADHFGISIGDPVILNPELFLQQNS